MQPEFVTFKLGEDPQVYSLKFDFNQVANAESEAGCNLMGAVVGGGSITATQTRALLYACLKTAHPQVLLTEAGGLLNRDMETVLEALGKVMNATRGIEEPAEGPLAPPSPAPAE